jgi:hypothetical protein
MASYWIVVPRGNEELFRLLSAAFRGRTGFSVIEDRRTADTLPLSGERRGSGAPLGPDEIVVAERADKTARTPRAARTSTTRSRQGRHGSRQVRGAEPSPARRDHRFLTL